MRRRYLIAGMILTVLSVVGIGTGWTLAWLTAETQSIRNIFTVGSVQIALTETANTDTNEDQKPDCWTGALVPGTKLYKDPKVMIPEDSEDSWVFVQLTETNWPTLTGESTTKRKVEYEIEDGWHILPHSEKIYFREVKKSDSQQVFSVLKNNQVQISENITKTEIKAMNDAKLTVAAYAVQRAGFDTPEAAWNEIKPNV